MPTEAELIRAAAAASAERVKAAQKRTSKANAGAVPSARTPRAVARARAAAYAAFVAATAKAATAAMRERG